MGGVRMYICDRQWVDTDELDAVAVALHEVRAGRGLELVPAIAFAAGDENGVAAHLTGFNVWTVSRGGERSWIATVDLDGAPLSDLMGALARTRPAKAAAANAVRL